MSKIHATDTRDSDLVACLLLVAFTAVSTLLVQSRSVINHDVAFLAWTAREVMGPAVFGVDIYEVNPPLTFMIYTPAAVIAPLTGFALAIKLWVTALGCLSVAMFWQTCDIRLRLPLAVTLSIFIAFVLPAGFAQRELIAFMLTAPYVAGSCRNRAGSVVVGIMAGVGFAIKPYFLIPLALVYATRRKIEIAEWAIVATGVVYAVTLLLFFQPYIFEFIPLARATYWAMHLDRGNTWDIATLILLMAVPFSLAGAPQPAARGFLAATFGFTIAAIIQFKGFGYHFDAALGYLILLLMARVYNAQRIVAVCAAITLLTLSYVLSGFTWAFLESRREQDTLARFLPEVDRSKSFLSFAIAGDSSFPTALYTSSDYKGHSGWNLFMKAARDPLSGPELRERAEQVSITQAISELKRQPELIIVERMDTAGGWGRAEFDLLSFFKTDARFRELWGKYDYDKTITAYDFAAYDLYRLR